MKADTAPGTDRRTRAAAGDAGGFPLTRRGFLVAAAYALGTIEPTHLDAHQHLLQLGGPEVFGALVRAARETRLPFRLARSWDQRAPYLLKNEVGRAIANR